MFVRFIFILWIGVISAKILPPIIFVPGSFCSLIEVRINTTLQPSCSKSFDNQWILLWLNLRLFEPEHWPCFQTIFSFVFNSTTENFVSPPGVETRVVMKTNDSSFLEGLLWEYVGLDQFLFHFVTHWNYIDGLNLRSIPYDFRRGTEQSLLIFVENLQRLVESTYNDNANNSVTLVSHSTGGSMVLFFLSQQSQTWKDRYIRHWISLSGNLAGEVDNLESVAEGFLSPIIPRQVLQTWDFFAWRLPESMIYGGERVLIESATRNYTAVDLVDFLRLVDAKDLARIYPRSSAILATLPAPNVTTYCFFGVNVSTPIAYRLNERRLKAIDGWGDGEQDDTTNMSCALWKKTMDKKYPLFLRGFDRVHHTALVGNGEVLQSIDGILFS